MRNLRTQFGKEMGKVKSSKVSGTGTGDVYIPAWKWFKELDFLRDSISPVKTKPTPGVPVVSIDQEGEENVEPNSAVNEEENDGPGTSTLPSQVPAKQNKRHIKDIETEILTKSLVLLESATMNRKRPRNDDDEEIFGRHVAKSLSKITDKRSRELAKMKIQQILLVLNLVFSATSQKMQIILNCLAAQHITNPR